MKGTAIFSLSRSRPDQESAFGGGALSAATNGQASFMTARAAKGTASSAAKKRNEGTADTNIKE